MFKKASYLSSPLFYVAFFLIFFALTEAIILFFDKQNFEALQRVFSIVGLLIVIIFDYWLREVKLSTGTRLFLQIIIAIPLAVNFLYPYSKNFYEKVIINKTFYESQIKINNTKTKHEFVIIMWGATLGKTLPAKEPNKQVILVDFNFDTANILTFKNDFNPSVFEKLKYNYHIKDSSLSQGEIEFDKNPEYATTLYRINKTNYYYHVFKVIYDSNNEPYLLQAVNFDTDKTTMRKAIEQINIYLQKNWASKVFIYIFAPTYNEPI